MPVQRRSEPMTITADLFRRGIGSFPLALEDTVTEHFCRYLAELQKWNSRINLVAKAPEKVLVESHFLDSLTLAGLVKDCRPPGLVDVGSGAGFPGLVLKIACPNLQVTLIEPRQKRAAFLRHIIRTLELQGVAVLETRLTRNSSALHWHNSIPIMTSRAFTSIGAFLDLAEPFCAQDGRVILMKGRKAGQELAAWKDLFPDSCFRLAETIEAFLPLSGTPRKILVFRKEPAM